MENISQKSYMTNLHLHCSFIAHFNLHGFYATYFDNPEQTMKFLKQFDKDYSYKSVEYGTTYWFTSDDYHDLNSEMAYSLEPYKAKIYDGLKQIEQLKSELEGSK